MTKHVCLTLAEQCELLIRETERMDASDVNVGDGDEQDEWKAFWRLQDLTKSILGAPVRSLQDAAAVVRVIAIELERGERCDGLDMAALRRLPDDLLGLAEKQ